MPRGRRLRARLIFAASACALLCLWGLSHSRLAPTLGLTALGGSGVLQTSLWLLGLLALVASSIDAGDGSLGDYAARWRGERKRALFALGAATVALVGLELAARAVYFQRHGARGLALVELPLELGAERELAKRRALAERVGTSAALDALYEPGGADLLHQLREEYERRFLKLIEEARRVESRVLVLYVPSRGQEGPAPRREVPGYFAGLAERSGVEFLDVTEQLYSQPLTEVTLLPQNGHLSRLGNLRVAEAVCARLDRLGGARTTRVYAGDPARCADLPPGRSELWSELAAAPYRVTSNAQGFRGTADVEVPKRRQRVLVLGDSFTFGPYLPDHDTFPAIAGRLRPNLEVLNAGMAGYTIADQEELFRERASRVAPDITVLQVLDNDIVGLTALLRNEFDRKGRTFVASPLEEAFLARLDGGASASQ